MSDGYYGYSEALTISGLGELQSKLTAFGEKVVNKTTQLGLNDGAKIMKIEAISRTKNLNKRDKTHLLKVDGVYIPLDPGNLSEEIRQRQIRKTEPGTKVAQVYVKGRFAWYGKLVEGAEMGTSRQAPTPFMRPTYEDKQGKAVEAFEKRISQAVEDGGLK